MGQSKKEESETRCRLLAASVDLFYDKGVNATTLEDIASAAGVSRGAIYWHFGNKLGLFSALYSEMHRNFMEPILEKGPEVEGDPLDKLAELCVKSLSDVQTNVKIRKMISIFYQKCDYSGDMAPFLQDQNQKTKEMVLTTATFFERAVKQKVLPEHTDCTLLAYSLFCYMYGLTIENIRHPECKEFPRKAQAVIGIFFRGLRAVQE
ncbi:MAG: TetR family transcriptional regulator [Candidatus Cloacimonetes bacterium]|nr:TetR family transcriptional regulator [Candidatus Cloacimonadota bacterium]